MKVVVVGGNAAGMSAASRLMRRSEGSIEVYVFEKTEEVSYGACGLPYYISGENENIDLMRIRRPEDFLSVGINLFLNHEATDSCFTDKTVTFTNRKTGETRVEAYDKLIISSGSSPILPPFKGVNLKNVFVLKTLDDGEAIKTAMKSPSVKKVAIVGGGYIGLELAEACVAQNKEVYLFEALPQLLNGFDPEFSDMAKQELLANGVHVFTNTRVESLEGSDAVNSIHTSLDSYQVDLVIVSVGVRPNTQFCRHEELEMLPNGAIVVDTNMRTSLNDVFSAGDCATSFHKILKKPVYIPLGTNANKQGRFVADVILGKTVDLNNVLGTAMLRCLDLELAKTGITETEAKANGIDVKTVLVKANSHARYYPDPAQLTIKLCYDPETMVLLGAQLAGRKECAVRVNIYAVAIDQEMTTTALGRTDMGYAPPFSNVWDAVQQAANVAK